MGQAFSDCWCCGDRRVNDVLNDSLQEKLLDDTKVTAVEDRSGTPTPRRRRDSKADASSIYENESERSTSSRIYQSEASDDEDGAANCVVKRRATTHTDSHGWDMDEFEHGGDFAQEGEDEALRFDEESRVSRLVSDRSVRSTIDSYASGVSSPRFSDDPRGGLRGSRLFDDEDDGDKHSLRRRASATRDSSRYGPGTDSEDERLYGSDMGSFLDTDSSRTSFLDSRRMLEGTTSPSKQH
ncbi:hypothetical protein Poli38472_001842 [Pythium oligandrum]|uniref:Uncharacterized protein n=1 Tax=Pythium oligandrum TaxID=41045 RepID=A0A8K1CW37_PYTOL|nr:hypothetical protein Poli38472_001842 [Pythium oligandrum]|eukprot:TMW69686.1 hypothetical protein Poli38472_001842 [Pythium oligandrum]